MLAAPTDAQYAALAARDARHDGWFIVAVTSTGIYCRPSCPARTPHRDNVRIAPTAAAAQGAGFRACMRCRPDASPGSPEWDLRGDIAGRAMRLIADGLIDREGVSGLARRIGYSERHLHRILLDELGAGAIALARAQRAQTARILIETTDLPMGQVALAAGFQSLRQFNDTVREIFATTPTDLRARRTAAPRPTRRGVEPASFPATTAPGALRLRLAYRPPLDHAALWRFLAARALPGVELSIGAADLDAAAGADTDISASTGEARGTTTPAIGVHRTLRLPGGHGRVTLRTLPGSHAIDCELRLEAMSDLAAAVTRCRALLDLDADPSAIDTALAAAPELRASVLAGPGRRLPGAVDGLELAVRAVLGQQISVAAARTLAGRIAAEFGEPCGIGAGVSGVPEHLADADRSAGDAPARREPSRVFPAAEQLAEADLTQIGLPRARARTISALAEAVATGDLDLAPGADRDATAARLQQIDGIGPWTTEYVLARALRDPDRFPDGDLILRRALGTAGAPATAAQARAAAEPWRPWRSYALLHLWDPALTDTNTPRAAQEAA